MGMNNTRLLTVALLLVGLGAGLSCSGGNHSTDDPAEVYFSVDISQGPADQNVSSTADLTIPNFSISSHAKSPTTTIGHQQDTYFTEWVVTPSRSDGGTVASPVWRNYYNVFVPGGGNASLANYRIFPAEYYRQPPLNQLFPENGGIDRETGKSNIRQRLQVSLYGKTVAGQSVVCSFPVDVNFIY
jgi:hypothetical protein